MLRRSIIICVLLLTTTNVGAQPATDPADAEFRQGNSLYKEQRWAEARDAYDRAWQIKKAHDIAANLAYAEMKLGRFRDAAEHLTFAVKTWPPTGKADKRDYAIERLQLARSEVGTLKIEVNLPRADVLVDGRRIGQAPLDGEVFVEPGTVRVSARSEGYAAAEQVVSVQKGEAREVTLALAAVKPERRSVRPAVVMGSIGGAALVAGVALLVEGAAKRSDSKTLNGSIESGHTGCIAGATNFDARCPQLHDLALAAGTFHDAGIGVLVGAGAAGLATAAYLLWPSSTPSRPAALRVTPVASATNAGLLFSGSF